MVNPKTRATGVRALIAIPLIAHRAQTADKTAAAKARCPVTGRIWTVVPVYGEAYHAGGGGDAVFTDIAAQLKNGAQAILGDGAGAAAEHELWSGSDYTTDEPAEILAAGKDVTAGDVLQLDLNVTGGTNPSCVGFGYVVLVEPTV